MWRHDAENVAVPEAEREWQEVRRRMRGGATAGAAAQTARSRRNVFAWLVVPLGAAAACAVAFMALRQETPAPVRSREARIAHADYVEAPGRNAAIMISVDEKSGWVFVTASDDSTGG